MALLSPVSWGRALVELLFPAQCLGCGKEGTYLCLSCQASLPEAMDALCQRCGMPLEPGEVCAACKEAVGSLDGIRSPFLMLGLVREAIHHLKYRNLRALAGPLGGLLWGYLEAHPLPVEALTPVPLHPRRLRERGHNQAALLARELGRRADLPLLEGSLVRVRASLPQARASNAQQRRANVEGAFLCRGHLEGLRILLVDDVCTTGATLEACAVALKKAGAASVWGLTLAREA